MPCSSNPYKGLPGILSNFYGKKPLSSIPRYHMFLSSLSSTCKELGLSAASAEFSAALSSILSAASHTNTMMWIGKMEDCPFDLAGQGQLLKQGRVGKQELMKIKRKWGQQKTSVCQLLLFQESLVLCRTNEDPSEPNNPHLFYENHIR